VGNTRELEVHYAKYHAWVCQADEAHGTTQCSKVFPDGRLLELHQTECHDPIAAVRKDRGEKIFACFLPSSACSKVFLTPKARRLHLIAAHAYPKEYFFAVVNKGVGGLLAKWGDGAGMVRGEWKSRPTDRDEGKLKIRGKDEDEDEDDSSAESESEIKDEEHNDFENIPTSIDMDVDTLTTSFQSSLSFSPVPSSIRFGRGTSRGGRARGGRGQHYISNSNHHYTSSPIPSESTTKAHQSKNETTKMKATANPDFSAAPRRARGGFRGGGGRGRGRGRGVGLDGGFT